MGNQAYKGTENRKCTMIKKLLRLMIVAGMLMSICPVRMCMTIQTKAENVLFPLEGPLTQENFKEKDLKEMDSLKITAEVVNLQPDKDKKIYQNQEDRQESEENASVGDPTEFMKLSKQETIAATPYPEQNTLQKDILTMLSSNEQNNYNRQKIMLEQQKMDAVTEENVVAKTGVLAQQNVADNNSQTENVQPEKEETEQNETTEAKQVFSTGVLESTQMKAVINATVQGTELVGLEEQAQERKISMEAELARIEKANKIKEQKKIKTAAQLKKDAYKIKLSNQDKNVLLRIVEAEATGEDIQGKMLVANVILNRVNNKKEFPNSVTKVVFDHQGGRYQFSPVQDGRYYKVSVSKSTRRAVDRVLKGEDESKGALYFMARKYASPRNVVWFDNSLTRLFRHGAHEFYK